MHIVDIEVAKNQLSELVELAINGQEIIITKSGKPFAKLISNSLEKPKEKPKRPFGVLKGKIKISDDFDDPCEIIFS